LSSWSAAASGARHRFQTACCKSGVSPVPRQPPQSKTLACDPDGWKYVNIVLHKLFIVYH
jgi:hypothetical protein